MAALGRIILFAKDPARMVEFFAAAFSLQKTVDEPGWIVLTGAAGGEIAIHAIPERIASSIELTSPPQARANTAIKPVFFTLDLQAAAAAVSAAGGELGQRFDYEGSSFQDFCDPEGNVLQLCTRPE